MKKNEEAAKAMTESGWEIASHGYRWIDYQNVDEETEREHIKKTVEIQQKITGSRPLGIYQGKVGINTRRLIAEEGGFLYDADAYNDDLPYWNLQYSKPHLTIPYTLLYNDVQFLWNGVSGDQFFNNLKDAFDFYLEEGRKGNPKMMSIGLHGRIVGHAGRAHSLARFLDYVLKFQEEVWICRRIDIANHWYAHHYPAGYEKKI